MFRNLHKVVLVLIILSLGLNAASCNSMSGEKRKIKRALMSLDLSKVQQDRLYQAEMELDNNMKRIENSAKNSRSDQLYTFFTPNQFDKRAFSRSVEKRQKQSRQAILNYIDKLYVILTPGQMKSFRNKLR